MEEEAQESQVRTVTGSIALVVYSDGRAEIQTSGVFEKSPHLVKDLLDSLTEP